MSVMQHPGQLRLGITGGIGSGKSYVSHMLHAIWGVPVYDCDSRAKYLTAHSEQIREALVNLVGAHLWQQGRMQKAVLAEYLFANAEHAAQVDAIIHPAVWKDFLRWAKEHDSHPVVAMESAILCESGFHQLVDCVMLVDCDDEVRIRRAMARDGAQAHQIRARMALQNDARARQMARFVVHNDDKPQEPLQDQLRHVMHVLKQELISKDEHQETNI
ncbi:MAG: dephospho-CoA kinase [Bacteroidaceae bacterium]